MSMGKGLYPFLAAALLLAGCASTETLSPEMTAAVPSAAGAQWTFGARTTWANPVRITLYINKTTLTGVSELSPGNYIGSYQGHVIQAQCKTEWPRGAFGSGTCYLFVDGVQATILLL